MDAENRIGKGVQRVRVTNEQIISALFECESNRAAAEAVGLSESGLYERMRAPEFRSLLADTKARILEAAASRAESRLESAISTMHAVMVDEENGAQVRLNAADALLRQTLKLMQLVDVSQRLDRIEAAIAEAEK